MNLLVNAVVVCEEIGQMTYMHTENNLPLIHFYFVKHTNTV